MALPAAALSSTAAVALPSTPAVAVPSTPAVSLLSHSYWTERFPGGATGLHIVGQVQNTTPAALGNAGINVELVRININLTDAIPNDASYTYATVAVLGPNEVSPFELDLVPEPAGYTTYSIGAISYTPAIQQPYHSQLTAQLTPLTDLCPQDDASGRLSGEVCGTVTNTGPIPVENVRAVLTYRNGPTTVAEEHPIVLNASGGTTLGHNQQGWFDFLLSPSEPVGTGSPLLAAEPLYPLDLNPDHPDFGAVNAGKSGQLVVTVTNTGSVTVTFNAPYTNPSPEYTASSDCANSGLSSGQSCHVTVTFTPTAAGTRSGTLTLTDTAAGSQQVIPLTGEGTAPAVSFDRAVLDFGKTVRAGATGTMTANLTNTGNGPLTITAFATDDPTDFSVDGSGCLAAPFTIQPDPDVLCPIIVTFHPQAAGPYGDLPKTNLKNVNLIVTDDAGTGTQKLPLQGIALGPGAVLTANGQAVSAIDLGDQLLGFSSASATVTLTNNGTEALAISHIAASGDFGEINSCPQVSLAAGASCTISINFKPSQLGPRTGTLTITDNAYNPQQSVALTGNGVSGVTNNGSGRRADSGIGRSRMPPATFILRRR